MTAVLSLCHLALHTHVSPSHSTINHSRTHTGIKVAQHNNLSPHWNLREHLLQIIIESLFLLPAHSICRGITGEKMKAVIIMASKSDLS